MIISGANLSNDYFTNRQDRYVLIDKCEKLADFYEKFVNQLSKISLQMDASEKFEKSADLINHPYQGSLSEFQTESRDLIRTFLEEERVKVGRKECQSGLLSDVDLGLYCIFPLLVNLIFVHLFPTFIKMTKYMVYTPRYCLTIMMRLTEINISNHVQKFDC